jgi:hypothetical protein
MDGLEQLGSVGLLKCAVIKIACKPITRMGGVSVLKTERSDICVGNVSDQSARKYKEKFSIQIEYQGSLYPVLKSSDTEYCFFASSHCRLGLCNM